MKTIYKYPFSVDDHIAIRMPKSAEILSVQVQGGTTCMWALVDSEESTLLRQFKCRGTGHDCSDLRADKFVGTFQLAGGALVFHLFEA